MHTNNIPKGTFQITLTNTLQYLIMGLFYIAVTKTNALTQTDIGALSILSFLSSTIILITGLALPTALTKFASEKLGKNQPEEAASVQKTVTKTVLTLSIAGFVIAIVLSNQLSQYLFGPSTYAHLIILMLIYTLFSSIMTLYNSTLRALYLFGKMATVTLTFIIISRTTAVTLAILHMGLEGVIIGYVVGSIAALITALVFIRGRLPKTTHNAPLKPILKFSLPLFLSSLTLLILNRADIVIITALTLDYSLTGIYYIALNSVTVLSILWIPITTTIFPALSAKHGSKKPEDITNILKTSSRYLIYIILPSCLGLAAISPTALAFFYGQSYTPGAIPLSILSIATIIIALYSLFTTALVAIGKTTQILIINVVLAISTVTILLAAVPFLQTTGAALTRLIIQIIGIALAFYILHKEIPVKIDKEALWKSALATTATIPLLLILEATISKNLPITQTLIIEILTAATIYALSLYILKALKTQDFELLRQALPKTLTKYINFIEKIITR
ncbi:MAG: oligosaccharide flippase family protein [Candidatus Bathyarchaeota archaeon]|nr:oligosaccharide flippase family protein [Candidatus Bathyarchaeota archaeon]